MKFSLFSIPAVLLAGAFLWATGYAAYQQEPVWMLIPLSLLAMLFLVQQPKYLFYLLLASIPWSIEYNFSSSLGTDLPDEPMMLLLSVSMIIVLVWTSRERRPGRMHPLVLLLLVQFCWTFITVLHSTDILLSVKYLLAKSWYLLAFVAAPLYLFREEKTLKTSALVLLVSMMVLLVVAQTRHALLGFTFEAINDAVAPFFRNHVNYSALLVFMVPLLIACLRLSNSRWWRTIAWAFLLLTLAGLYFSYARGAWLALLTGATVYWLIRRRLLTATYFVLIALCLGALVWLRANDNYLRFSNDFKSTVWHENFREHLIATYKLKDASTAERFYRWVAGVRMTADRWETGFGPGTFYWNYKGYALPAFKTWVSKNPERSTVHNYFLLLGIEQGILGLLLFVLLLGGLFRYAQHVYHRSADPFWKSAVLAAAAILMMEVTINFLSDLIESDKVGSVFYLCLAVIVVADRKRLTQ